MVSSGMGRSKNWNQGWDGAVIVRKEKTALEKGNQNVVTTVSIPQTKLGGG